MSVSANLPVFSCLFVVREGMPRSRCRPTRPDPSVLHFACAVTRHHFAPTQISRRDRHDARDERNESLCTARRISGRYRSTTPAAGPPTTNAEPMPVIDRFVLL